MKIVEVVNAMISQKAKINDVIKNNKEYFFVFNEKYNWSISKDNGFFYLHFYADKQYNIRELADYIGDWNFIDFITYSDKEIKTREATESLSELYQIIIEKLFNLDKVFEDIINTDLF